MPNSCPTHAQRIPSACLTRARCTGDGVGLYNLLPLAVADLARVVLLLQLCHPKQARAGAICVGLGRCSDRKGKAQGKATDIDLILENIA